MCSAPNFKANKYVLGTLKNVQKLWKWEILYFAILRTYSLNDDIRVIWYDENRKSNIRNKTIHMTTIVIAENAILYLWIYISMVKKKPINDCIHSVK